jgi:hypothetical protein
MCGRKILILLAAAMAAGHAQVPVTPAAQTLARVQAHIAEGLRALPNYTCLQEIVRSVREPGDKKLVRTDTIRLEVVVAGDRELFAWPGEKNFADSEIHEIIRGGAIGSGLFGLFTKQLFESRGATFEPHGETTVDGRRVLEYAFRVPEFLAPYIVIGRGSKAGTGYGGRFWADATTHDLVEMELSAVDLPPDLEYESVRHRVEYAKVAALRDAILPARTTSTLKHLTSKEYRSEGAFTACREFTSESAILVEDVSSKVTAEAPLGSRLPSPLPALQEAAAEAPEAHATRMPARLRIELRLQSALDHERTAAGDVVAARVTENVVYEGKVVLPKGTALTGRIHRFERQADDAYIVSIQFPIRARLEAVDRKKRVLRDPGGGGAYATRAPSYDFVQDPLSEWEKEQATFEFRQAKIPRGFQMVWITL